MRITIGLKIFAIAIGLIGLMAVVALLTTRLARDDVGDQLDFVVEQYVPGYGHLARAQIRSVPPSPRWAGEGGWGGRREVPNVPQSA